MFPIYVCCDSSVTETERRAIDQGLMEVRPLFGCDIIGYGTNSWMFGRYKSADQVINSLRRNKYGQVDAGEVLDRLTEISMEWSEQGAIVLMTGLDLYADMCDWCFGMARSKMTVQSTRRYRGLSSDLMSECLRRTLRHELGHIFGCAGDTKRSNTEYKLGPHCTNKGCSMRQTMSIDELLAVLPQENPKSCFCGQCMHDLWRFEAKYESTVTRTPIPLPRKYELNGAIHIRV